MMFQSWSIVLGIGQNAGARDLCQHVFVDTTFFWLTNWYNSFIINKKKLFVLMILYIKLLRHLKCMYLFFVSIWFDCICLTCIINLMGNCPVCLKLPFTKGFDGANWSCTHEVTSYWDVVHWHNFLNLAH